MPPTPTRPPQLRGRVFRAGDAVAAGLLTERQLRGASWRRLLRGTYADADLPVTHGLRIEAARLVLPDGALVAGRSAAWAYGAHDILGSDDPVEVLVSRDRRFGPVAGLHVRTVPAIPDADATVAGLTSRDRTVADLARWAPDVVEAVVRMDQFLRVWRPTDSWRAGCRARSVGSPRGVAAVGLADGRAESPQESRLRVGLVLRGLPPPVPQFVVRHDGHFIARVDLAYPEERLAIEYDGQWHADPGQLRRDRQRLNRLVGAGWRVVHVTASDLRQLDDVAADIYRLLQG